MNSPPFEESRDTANEVSCYAVFGNSIIMCIEDLHYQFYTRK